MTREDRNRSPVDADTSESCQPSVLSKGDSAVDGGEGVCATFLFEMPMGNASSLYNQPVPSTASTAATSSSTSCTSSSSSLLKEPVSQGGPGLSPGPHTKGSENNSNNNTINNSSSSSSSSSCGKGNGKLLSYGQRAHRMQEDNEEAYKRQSRLCPSFTTSQQVSTAPHSNALRYTA